MNINDIKSYLETEMANFNLYARFLDRNGRDSDLESAREVGLVKGELYKVTDVVIGQSQSSVMLKEFEGGFNTVMFEFFQPVDIFMAGVDWGYNACAKWGYIVKEA